MHKNYKVEHLSGRLIYLVVSLVLLLVLYPFLHNDVMGSALLNLLLTLVLFTGVYAVSKNTKQLVFGLALGIPWLVLSWLNIFSNIQGLALPAQLFAIGYYVFVLVTLFLYIIHAKKVTSDVLFGAVSIYLLLGLTWAAMFSLTETLYPASFIGTTIIPNWTEFIYYSFTTLTTLGYGDITPSTTFAQALSILEAVAGTLYLTVLLARLVGAYIAQHAGEIAKARKK